MSNFMRTYVAGDQYYVTEEEADAICAILGIENRNVCTVVIQPHNGDVRKFYAPEDAN